MTSPDIQSDAINTLRFLSVDAVQQAKAGHPGLPMGAAAMAYTIWRRHLRHNPRNPAWPDRDRFILSGGHGSALLYSLLHLTGYDLSLDEIKNFRQWGSRTPGHPEVHLTPGVETTTGPLGQGFANGVGFAIAEVTDGDLMEGVTSEAASLAGHLRLGKLIYLYDDNRITIEGSTELTFTEDRAARFAAYGWQVLQVADGNDVEAIDTAITQAKADPRPSLIICRTHIGFGLPTRQDTSKAHGEPPGDEELNGAKDKLGWPKEPRFYIPEHVLAHFRQAVSHGTKLEAEWNYRLDTYQQAFPTKAAELRRRLRGDLPKGWEAALPVFPTDSKGIATRAASGKVINALAPGIPELMGGSADLAPSTNTLIDNLPDFQKDTPAGRNFHFGVREHGMGSIANGLALHGGVIPYCASFLVFSDYARPAIRLSAISHIPVVWIFTHDSIGLGEDGPTHQPVEHLAALRAIPDLVVIRPADANETAEAWKVALQRRDGPTLLALTRQAVPTLDRSVYTPASELACGAYVLADIGDNDPELILMASGSEVSIIVAAGERLAAEGVNVRLVSFPSWELFAKESPEYRETVLPPEVTARIAVEAGVSQGWERWVGERGAIISLERYGASAPGKTIFDNLGFTADAVIEQASKLHKR
jgi:transketolase